MKKVLKIFGFFGLFFFLTVYNNIEAKSSKSIKASKIEKLKEGRIVNLPVNEAKEIELFRKIDITKMKPQNVLEEFDKYAQIYNGKVGVREASLLEVSKEYDWNKRVLLRYYGPLDFITELYRDANTRELFTGRIPKIDSNPMGIYIRYVYVYDGIYKRVVEKRVTFEPYEGQKIKQVLYAHELSYADNGEVYLKKLRLWENVEAGYDIMPLQEITEDEVAARENYHEMKNVMKHKKLNILLFTIEIPNGLSSDVNDTIEKIYYVWDAETGEYITKLKINNYLGNKEKMAKPGSRIM